MCSCNPQCLPSHTAHLGDKWEPGREPARARPAVHTGAALAAGAAGEACSPSSGASSLFSSSETGAATHFSTPKDYISAAMATLKESSIVMAYSTLHGPV